MKKNLKNIQPKIFRKYLEFKGLKYLRTNGGHEIWSRKDLKRPVIFQTHIDPIPEFIIRNNLKTLGEDINDLIDFLSPR
ncbi:MAG: type II toxin-antitoxin system HicA family toxin [Clostridiaceae bacterium]|nr:type II toxin-antitoxin system HicA family toxin [Clostridiaceae bacterium]